MTLPQIEQMWFLIEMERTIYTNVQLPSQYQKLPTISEMKKFNDYSQWRQKGHPIFAFSYGRYQVPLCDGNYSRYCLPL